MINAKELYIGNEAVKEVYLGRNLIWQYKKEDNDYISYLKFDESCIKDEITGNSWQLIGNPTLVDSVLSTGKALKTTLNNNIINKNIYYSGEHDLSFEGFINFSSNGNILDFKGNNTKKGLRLKCTTDNSKVILQYISTGIYCFVPIQVSLLNNNFKYCILYSKQLNRLVLYINDSLVTYVDDIELEQDTYQLRIGGNVEWNADINMVIDDFKIYKYLIKPVDQDLQNQCLNKHIQVSSGELNNTINLEASTCIYTELHSYGYTNSIYIKDNLGNTHTESYYNNSSSWKAFMFTASELGCDYFTQVTIIGQGSNGKQAVVSWYNSANNENNENNRHYIIKEGKLVDDTITLNTAKYYNQWSETDNRKIEYFNGYIQYTGSCKNREHGIIFTPFINTEGYDYLCIDANYLYNNSTDPDTQSGFVASPILGTAYGKTSGGNGLFEETKPSIGGTKYYGNGNLNSEINKFTVSNVDQAYLFMGAKSINNPDKGITVKIYNIWLEKNTQPHLEVNCIVQPYEQYLETGSEDLGFAINTGIYCDTLDYKLEYNSYKLQQFGYIHNNDTNGTWLGVNGAKVRYGHYEDFLDTDSLTNDVASARYYAYDMQKGLYYMGNLKYESTAEIGSDEIKNIPLYYGGIYDFYDNTVKVASNRIFPVKIYKQDILIRDLVPCIKDGMYYMYDKLNNVYYENINKHNNHLLSHE